VLLAGHLRLGHNLSAVARSDDHILTAEELRLRKHKRIMIACGALILLVLVLFFVLGVRPTFHAIKAFQARRHAKRAFALIEQQKWDPARAEAVAAYQMRPGEPQALRAAARFLSRTHHSDALEFWRELAGKTNLTREDLRDEASIALTSGETATAESAIKNLFADSRAVGAADELLAAQLAIQKNLPEEARPYLEKIFNDTQATEREQLQAALLQLSIAGKDDQNGQANTWKRIEKLAQGKDTTSLDALTLLGQRALARTPDAADSSQSSIADVVRALENHPLAKAAHKLLALDLRIHVDPAQRDALLIQAIDKWKNGKPNQLVALANWLNSNGEFQKTLDTIPLEKALQSHDLFLRHLDALGGLSRWEEIKELLRSERFPLDPVMEDMYLARCSAQMGEETTAENNWERALEAAGNDVQKLLTLAEYAEKNSAMEIAGAAYDRAAVAAPNLRPAHQGQLRIAEKKQNAKKMHAVLAEMEKLWPNDTAIRNDEAYTRLLLLRPDDRSTKSEAQTIEKVARDLIAHEPASLPHRTLLALALLRQERAEDALASYQKLNVPKNVLTPSALAVHAAILGATQHRDDAQSEAVQIPADKLLPEEKALIHDLLE
jgi:tetratricopeptide (TPR) repeat protein